MYTETSYNREGHFGELLGPNLRPSSSCMIRFCYHMYGATMGTLNVYKRNTLDTNPDDTQKVLFTLSGNQGNKWQCRFLNIPSSVQYSIVFESVRGKGYQSDIALDDIKFISCGSQGPPPPTYPPHQPSIIDEDFEKCLSCWSNDKSGHDQMDWRIGRGSTSSLNTGPSFDHTLKTIYGRYLYIEGNNKTAWDHADLESRPLIVQKRCYLTFWYHMYGSSVGSLVVSLYVYKKDAPNGKYLNHCIRLFQNTLSEKGTTEMNHGCM